MGLEVTDYHLRRRFVVAQGWVLELSMAEFVRDLACQLLE